MSETPPEPVIGRSANFWCQPDPLQVGVMQINGASLPTFEGWLYRQLPSGALQVVRGANGFASTGSFTIFDPEVSFTRPATYVLKIQPEPRPTFVNLTKNPSFDYTLADWTAGPGRTLSRTVANPPPGSQSTHYGEVTPKDPGDPATGDPALLIARASVQAADPYILEAGQTYIINGLIYPLTSGEPTFIDSLEVGLVNTSNALVGSKAAAVITPIDESPWSHFTASLSIADPQAGLSTLQIGFYHANTAEGIASTWRMDDIIVQRELEAAVAYVPNYFDGDSVYETDASTFIPIYTSIYNRVTDSGDASYTWTGTAGSSASTFTPPTSATIEMLQPCSLDIEADYSVAVTGICEPIHLMDPLVPSISGWFGLLSIEPLTYEARREVHTVLSRRAPVAISQVRSTPNSTLRLLTKTLEERQLMLDVMTSGRVLLLRNPDASYPENDWYLSIGGLTEERVIPDHRRPERRWVVEFVQVDRPGVLIGAVRTRTWAEVATDYASWNAVRDQNTNWRDLMLDASGPINPFTAPEGTYGLGSFPTVPAASNAWNQQPEP